MYSIWASNDTFSLDGIAIDSPLTLSIDRMPYLRVFFYLPRKNTILRSGATRVPHVILVRGDTLPCQPRQRSDGAVISKRAAKVRPGKPLRKGLREKELGAVEKAAKNACVLYGLEQLGAKLTDCYARC